MRERYRLGVITNDIFTREDMEFLVRSEALPPDRIIGVQTGGCPHTAIREDASMNFDALDEMTARHPGLDIVFLESGGDNLAASFSPELVDASIYVIDVSGGDKIPRKGGPGVTRSDLLVINKIDLAPHVGADLDDFPEYKDLDVPERRRITIRHALTMSAGFEWNEDVPYTDPKNDEIAMNRSPDPIHYVLARPMVSAPGTSWRTTAARRRRSARLFNARRSNRSPTTPARCSSRRLASRNTSGWGTSLASRRRRRDSGSGRATSRSSVRCICTRVAGAGGTIFLSEWVHERPGGILRFQDKRRGGDPRISGGTPVTRRRPEPSKYQLP